MTLTDIFSEQIHIYIKRLQKYTYSPALFQARPSNTLHIDLVIFISSNIVGEEVPPIHLVYDTLLAVRLDLK